MCVCERETETDRETEVLISTVSLCADRTAGSSSAWSVSTRQTDRGTNQHSVTVCGQDGGFEQRLVRQYETDRQTDRQTDRGTNQHSVTVCGQNGGFEQRLVRQYETDRQRQTELLISTVSLCADRTGGSSSAWSVSTRWWGSTTRARTPGWCWTSGAGSTPSPLGPRAPSSSTAGPPVPPTPPGCSSAPAPVAWLLLLLLSLLSLLLLLLLLFSFCSVFCCFSFSF